VSIEARFAKEKSPTMPTTVDVKLLLIDLDDYAYSDAHEFLSDIAAGIIATSPALTGKTVSDLGAFDCDDPVFAAVAGNQSEALICFIDTGTPSTSRLVVFQDTGVTGLPITPNGGDITLTVDAAGLFVL
jgi:hypothetical protein